MKLYIGNLPYTATELELREALADYEPIEDIYYPVDRETGEHKGFAFVTLSTREMGEEAIKNLQGADFGGRALRVNEAEERRKPAPRGGGGFNKGGGGGYRGGGGGGGYNKGGGGGYKKGGFKKGTRQDGGGGGGGGYKRDDFGEGGGGYNKGDGGGYKGKRRRDDYGDGGGW